jgi:hypothetical protein
MPTSDNINMEDWASAVVDGDGTVRKVRGCRLDAYTPGSGSYQFTLDRGLNSAECTAVITLRDTTPTVNTVPYLQNVSDTVKRVQIFQTSNGAECSFTMVLRKIL